MSLSRNPVARRIVGLGTLFSMVVIFILGLHIYLEYIDPFVRQSMDFLSKPYLLVLGLFASIIATRLLFHVSAPRPVVEEDVHNCGGRIFIVVNNYERIEVVDTKITFEIRKKKPMYSDVVLDSFSVNLSVIHGRKGDRNGKILVAIPLGAIEALKKNQDAELLVGIVVVDYLSNHRTADLYAISDSALRKKISEL